MRVHVLLLELAPAEGGLPDLVGKVADLVGAKKVAWKGDKKVAVEVDSVWQEDVLALLGLAVVRKGTALMGFPVQGAWIQGEVYLTELGDFLGPDYNWDANVS